MVRNFKLGFAKKIICQKLEDILGHLDILPYPWKIEEYAKKKVFFPKY